MDDGGPGADRLARAHLRWRAAEDRLYPQVMTDPEAYQRVVVAVSAVLNELRRRAETAAELLALETQPAEVLAAVDPSATAGIGDELLLQAACALRSRELAAVTGSENDDSG
jgi:hypothetical protein